MRGVAGPRYRVPMASDDELSPRPKVAPLARVARNLAGAVIATVGGWASTEAPMGGFKDSGLGRRHGSEGILKYTEGQNVTVQRGLPIAPPKGVPAEAFARWFTGALKAVKRVPGIR